MPKYKEDIKQIIHEEDVKKVYEATKSDLERVLISLLWLTGGRPSELIEIYKEDTSFTREKLVISIKTLKIKSGKKFAIDKRPLEFERPHDFPNIYIETIIRHIKYLPAESKLLPRTKRWTEKVICRLCLKTLGKEFTPYHFRHSVFTWLAHNNYTVDQIMYFKGARSVKSVAPYLHAIPFVVKMQNLRRG